MVEVPTSVQSGPSSMSGHIVSASGPKLVEIGHRQMLELGPSMVESRQVRAKAAGHRQNSAEIGRTQHKLGRDRGKFGRCNA